MRATIQVWLISCFIALTCCNCGSDEAVDHEVNSASDPIISWTSDTTLHWSDFRKPIDGTEKFSAETRAGIHWNPVLQISSYMTTVNAVFDRRGSYVVPDSMSKDVLVHENMHFNLYELAARDLRHKITEWPGSRFGVFEEFVDSCAHSIIDSLNIRQAKYDEETNHGVNALAQNRWNQHIDSLLNATNSLSPVTVYVEYKVQ